MSESESEDGALVPSVDPPRREVEGAASASLPSGRLVGVAQGVGTWLMLKKGPILGSLVLGGVLGWVLHAGALPVIPPRTAFASTRWWAVGCYAVAWVALQILRALRWQLLLSPIGRVPLARVARLGLMGYGALLVLPFRMGEAVRPALIRKRTGLSLMAATGTIGAERIIDGLFLSLMLVAALVLATPVSPLPDHIGELPVPAAVVPGAAFAVSITFVALFLAMAAFYFFRVLARSVTVRLFGLLSEPLAERIAAAVERLATGLGFLGQWKSSVPFVLLTVLYWLGYAAGAWLLLWGVGLPDVSFAETAAICGVLAVGVIVPSAPGFFGSFQISVYAGMVMFLPLESVIGPGAAFVFLLYAIQVGSTLLLGLVAALIERRTVAN